MLPGLASWRRQLMPDGVAFAHPDGPERGAVHVRDRVRPLSDIRALASDLLRRMPATLADGALTAPRYVTTLEGEYAATITLTARVVADGSRYVRALGVVLGDDFQRHVDGFLIRPTDDATAIVERVEMLVRYACLGLGVRRRRYLYAAPPGWHGRACGLQTRWFAPGFPHEAATIIVPPAIPVVENATIAELERLMSEVGPVAFEPDGPPEVEAVTSKRGLSGELSRTVGCYPGQPRTSVQVAELADRRYRYRLTLEATVELTTSAEHAFRAVLDSIAPLPEPTLPAVDSSVMSHWAD